MDQQEFVPHSPDLKGRHQQDQDGELASSYYRKSGNGPKEEHPSTFEDTVPPYAYRAQDSRYTPSQAEAQPRQHRSDDAASSRAHHSYSRHQQQRARTYRTYYRTAPARPQPWKKTIIRWFLLILLVIVLIHVLPFFIVLILSVLGVLAVALLLPIFILLGLVAAVVIIALIAMTLLGIPIRRGPRSFHR